MRLKLLTKYYKVLGNAKDSKNLDHNYSIILNLEVVCHVLVHLIETTFHDDGLSFEHASSETFTKKEILIIA